MVYSGKPVEVLAKRYEIFYNQTFYLKRHLTIASFDDVITQLDTLISQVNDKFNIPLRYSENEVNDVQRAKNVTNNVHQEAIKKAGTPNPEREKAKADLSEKVDEYLLTNKSVIEAFEKIFY